MDHVHQRSRKIHPKRFGDLKRSLNDLLDVRLPIFVFVGKCLCDARAIECKEISRTGQVSDESHEPHDIPYLIWRCECLPLPHGPWSATSVLSVPPCVASVVLSSLTTRSCPSRSSRR